MRRAALAWVLLLLLGPAVAADKPVLINYIAGDPTDLDTLVHQYYAELYTVVDVTNRGHSFVYPKPKRDFGPTPRAYVEGRCLSGNVMLFYVITSEGAVTSPHAAGFTSPQLLRLAIRRISDWRFDPATLDGKAVFSVAASRFAYRCPAAEGK